MKVANRRLLLEVPLAMQVVLQASVRVVVVAAPTVRLLRSKRSLERFDAQPDPRATATTVARGSFSIRSARGGDVRGAKALIAAKSLKTIHTRINVSVFVLFSFQTQLPAEFARHCPQSFEERFHVKPSAHT